MGQNPTPPVSPWVWQSPDVNGNLIQITVNFSNSTLAISGGQVFRDPACLYTKVYIGLGANGDPASTPTFYVVPAGTTNLNKNQFSSAGFNTITDVWAVQITAGP